MLDAILRRQSEALLAPIATKIAQLGVSADSLTAAGFVLGIAALPDIGHRAYLVGLGLIVLGRVFDVADGAVARITGPTPFGTYLALVLDLIWTASVPFAFALAQPDRALAAMFLLFGLVARTAALSTDAKLKTDGIAIALEFGGTLVGKLEIFVALALACIFPDWFSVIAYVLGMMCFVMTGFRVAAMSAMQRP